MRHPPVTVIMKSLTPICFAGQESEKCGSMVIKVEHEDTNRRREPRRDIEGSDEVKGKINIETRRSTTLKQRVILVQGPQRRVKCQ